MAIVACSQAKAKAHSVFRIVEDVCGVEGIRFLPTFCAGNWWVDSYLGGECEIIVEL